ncbi:MAG: tetratricopeptide repeat protein [Halobacteriovoraceae bacterium]|jgi:Tfp pilus assembly protein PilF|nr:tetratricopeptide repeat protein [Halobacteriovoraceae bacterium]
MEKNFKHLLMAELHSASSYMERLFHGLVDITDLSKLPQCKALSEALYFDLMTFLESQVVAPSWVNLEPETPQMPKIRRLLQKSINLVEALVELDFDNDTTQENGVELINIIYEHAQLLHQFCGLNSTLDIQLPRVNLIQMKETEGELIPLFILPLSALIDLEEVNNIQSLGGQRSKKYQEALVRGHEFIFQKKYQEALESFSEALAWNETAEILTLVGWSKGLLGETGAAKEYCLKAIKKDRDYGPPYNDLGTYLLAEGQTEESLKWFQLAKKAQKYQNREYPYINAGRAYLNKKDIKLALEQFEKALELAPFNEDLERTILKLKANLEKSGAWKKKWLPRPELRLDNDAPKNPDQWDN